MKVLVVEDEVLVAEDISADLIEMGFSVTDIVVSGQACLSSFRKEKPDIVLMDIQIKGDMNGIELAAILKSISNPPIIFLTSNTDEATINKALETEPYSFISKPYNRIDLKTSIDIALNLHNEASPNVNENQNDTSITFFVKSGNVYKKIDLNEIQYIEASGSYSTIHSFEESYVVSSNLQKLEGKIRNHNFSRIHKSYLINLSHIEAFNQSSIIINGKNLPIGRAYRDDIFSKLQKL